MEQPLELAAWLHYHHTVVGVQRFFLRVEDTPRQALQASNPLELTSSLSSNHSCSHRCSAAIAALQPAESRKFESRASLSLHTLLSTPPWDVIVHATHHDSASTPSKVEGGGSEQRDYFTLIDRQNAHVDAVIPLAVRRDARPNCLRRRAACLACRARRAASRAFACSRPAWLTLAHALPPHPVIQPPDLAPCARRALPAARGGPHPPASHRRRRGECTHAISRVSPLASPDLLLLTSCP